MTSLIRNITFDCADPYLQSVFWGAATGWGEVPGDENHPDRPEAVLISPDGAMYLLFIPVPEGSSREPRTGRLRIHLDLMPPDRRRDEEVERLTGLGATLVGDHRKPDGTGWVVLADPEGNEFCVLRSDAERPAFPRTGTVQPVTT